MILVTFPSQQLSYYLFTFVVWKTFSFRVTTQTKQDFVVITGLICVPSASARF